LALGWASITDLTLVLGSDLFIDHGNGFMSTQKVGMGSVDITGFHTLFV
jgi:hypothetical protein